MTIRVVVDDNVLFRAGLVTVLDSDPMISVVAEASGGAEAVRVTREHQPTVVLMDIEMPDGDGMPTSGASFRAGTVLVLAVGSDACWAQNVMID